eukprot:TRINITY_DN36334_c0_g1_i2.p1 TRINITY_DN36334_c0_g1~~TRINITY_DN36334_c0_g1_i2.p1  ORF type:complete len:187 (-),score=39.41 TRINITY_DN36334_c0_g1_i2:4-564(-)
MSALKELQEESGLVLPPGLLLEHLPCAEQGHAEEHRNFSVVLKTFPEVPGPGQHYACELVRGGADGFGRPANDGYHVWADARLLLHSKDLLPLCAVPIQALLHSWQSGKTLRSQQVRCERDQRNQSDSGQLPISTKMTGWQRFRCPESHREWLWHERTEEMFFVDFSAEKGWEQFLDCRNGSRRLW